LIAYCINRKTRKESGIEGSNPQGGIGSGKKQRAITVWGKVKTFRKTGPNTRELCLKLSGWGKKKG